MNEQISFKTTKGEILKSMLRRPETAKLIKEALSSPVGSTSREKAKKIFSIMNKLHVSHDGAGGPGTMYERMGGSQPSPEMDPSHIPTDNSKGMVIFHKIPKPKITYGNSASKFKARAGSFDGYGGPGIPDGAGGLFGDMGSILSTFTKPFTDYLSTPIASLPSLPSSTPTTVTPSTPAPNMSTPGGGVAYGGGINSSYQNLPNLTPSYTPAPVTLPNTAPKTTPTPTPLPNPIPTPSAFKNLVTGVANMSTPNGDAYVGPDGKLVYPNKSVPDTTTPSATTPDVTTPPPTSTTSNVNSQMRTDRHNNPTAFITDLAKQAGLVEGVDYTVGDPFTTSDGKTLYTARLIGDPIAQTIKVLDAVGFYTADGKPRWSYLDSIPEIKNWSSMTTEQKAAVIEKMHKIENGSGSGTDTSTPASKYTGLSSLAQNAVDQNTGPGIFAINNNPLPNATELQKTLWDKYNIGGLMTEESRLREEGAVLPKDVTAYITARDQYLKQTDKEIDNFIDKSMTESDMSNPANAAKANAQLNYLYTLRGRQNQSYIGYLNDAVEQHQAELDHVSNLYSTALTAYQNDITAGTADYNTMAAALADMYTAVEGAPLKAQQSRLYEEQILGAHASAIADAVKSSDQTGFISQANKLEGYVWTTDHMAMPGVDLVKTINDFAALDPTITPANIIQTYASGVNNYLNAPTTKGTATNPGLTFSDQKAMAEEAVKQFANFAIAGSDNPNTVLLGQQSASDVADKLGNMVGSTISNSGKAPQLMEAVKSLAPTGWFGAKTSPTVDQFVKNVVGKTSDPLDESIARAIYAVFDRYVKDGGTPASAVDSLLYSTSSTDQRATPTALTPDQFAQNIGSIYASDIYSKAFAAFQQ